MLFQAGFDVFNALDLMENRVFLEQLKFGIGDGNLQYYLYNWRCPSIPPNKVSYCSFEKGCFLLRLKKQNCDTTVFFVFRILEFLVKHHDQLTLKFSTNLLQATFPST